MRMTLDTRQASGLVARFYAADARAQTAIRRVVERNGYDLLNLASALAPFRTGFLLAHLKLRFGDGNLTFNVGWDEADFAAAGLPPYFLYTEFGTRYMAPRPCLFPARDLVVPKFRREIRQAVRGAIRRRARAAGGR